MELIMPNAGTIFWMLIIFGIALFILKRFAWKPILNALHEREESITAALNSAEEAKKQVAEMKASNEEIIAETRREKDIILKEGKELNEKIIAEAKATAAREAKKIIDQSRQQIQNEKTAAINDIKKQVAELSVMIAEKVIKKQLAHKGEQEKLIDGLIDDIKLN